MFRVCCLAVAVTAVAAHAVELENWRGAWGQALAETGLLRASPSAMFWDDLTVEDTAVARALAWPDTSGMWRPGSWRLEPSVRGMVSSERYPGNLAVAGQVMITSDIRFRRLLVRHALDVDSRYKSDSTFVWKKDRVAAGRVEEAYLQVGFEHALFRLGRLKRSWGPFADASLVLSAVPHTYDALEWQVHASFFEYRHLFAAFDHSRSSIDTDSLSTQRYLTTHALNIIAGRWLTLGVFESVLFSSPTFPDLQYVNPFSIYTVTNTNGEADGNLMLGFQWRILPLTTKVELLGQVVFDDVQVDNETIGDQEPSHWGLDAAVYWHEPFNLRARHTMRLRYTYLSRWMYLVSRPNTLDGERYTLYGQGLGYGFNDGDRWDLGMTVVSDRGWSLRAGALYQRSGGNSVTSPWNSGDSTNPDAGYNSYRHETSLRSDTCQHLLAGYVEARGGWRGYVDAGVRLSAAWVRNRDNVPGNFAFEPEIAADMSLQVPRLAVRFVKRRGGQAQGDTRE